MQALGVIAGGGEPFVGHERYLGRFGFWGKPDQKKQCQSGFPSIRFRLKEIQDKISLGMLRVAENWLNPIVPTRFSGLRKMDIGEPLLTEFCI